MFLVTGRPRGLVTLWGIGECSSVFISCAIRGLLSANGKPPAISDLPHPPVEGFRGVGLFLFWGFLVLSYGKRVIQGPLHRIPAFVQARFDTPVLAESDCYH